MNNPEFRKKVSEALRGKPHKWQEGEKNYFHKNIFSDERHYNWKGGISRLPYSPDWTAKLRKNIKDRDKNICYLCHSNKDIVVHHIDYNKKNSNPNNLVILCRKCNSKVNFKRNYWTNYFQAK